MSICKESIKEEQDATVGSWTSLTHGGILSVAVKSRSWDCVTERSRQSNNSWLLLLGCHLVLNTEHRREEKQ